MKRGRLAFPVLVLALVAPLAAACSGPDSGALPVRFGDRATFDADVQPVLAARCANPTCHGRPERALSLFAPHRYRADPARTYIDEPLTEAELAHNHLSASALATEQERPEDSLLVRKPRAEDAGTYHGGGRVFVDDTERDYRTLVAWIAGARP